MKLHDLRPAPGAHKKKTRVGRGIAAGQGKTAGRGTKGQKARAGGSIPAWFEGGQTPLHMRIPKLRGFRNPFKIEYEVVNIGAIAELVELGVLESGEMPGAKKAKGPAAPITVNQEILRAAGLVRNLNKPMKVLGHGEIATALFVVADAVSASARAKIEAAGGTVSLLEVPSTRRPALGLDGGHDDAASIGTGEDSSGAGADLASEGDAADATADA
jgi:large subunit ribosomal protein L15